MDKIIVDIMKQIQELVEKFEMGGGSVSWKDSIHASRLADLTSLLIMAIRISDRYTDN